MLPNEVLLDTLHFVDYRTLVLAKLAGARLQHLVTNSAAGLACRRKFSVTVFFHWISCKDPSTKKSCHAGYYEGNQPSLAASSSSRPSAEICRGRRSVFGSTTTFSASSTGRSSAKYPRATFEYLQVSDTTFTWFERANLRIEGLVRYCLTLPRTLDGKSLELDFSGKYSRAALVRRIIELLKNSRRELTFRMRLWGDELVPAEDDYAVNVVNDNTKRYVAESSGIVVVVKGHRITVQSTAKPITE